MGEIPFHLCLALRWKTKCTRRKRERNTCLAWKSEYGCIIYKKCVCVYVSLTCWMSVSTILYRSGMCVTMSFMLSSDVRTKVGPNTRARLRGSIYTHTHTPSKHIFFKKPSVNPDNITVIDDCDTWLHFKKLNFFSHTLFLSELSATVFRWQTKNFRVW